MIKQAFSIRDAKAEIFHPPFLCHTVGEAERTFAQLAQDDKTYIGRNPEDYDLYLLGDFDDQTGKFAALPTPSHIRKAISASLRPHKTDMSTQA